MRIVKEVKVAVGQECLECSDEAHEFWGVAEVVVFARDTQGAFDRDPGVRRRCGVHILWSLRRWWRGWWRWKRGR